MQSIIILALCSAALGQVVIQGNVSVQGNVSISAQTLDSIVVYPASPKAVNGTITNFTAIGNYNTGSADITTQCSWSSSAPSIASLGTLGASQPATCNSAGTANISCSVAGLSALQPLTCAAPPTITTTSIPGGTINVAYSTPIVSTGGTGPFTWDCNGTACSSVLPTGVTLTGTTATSTLAGTPTVSGAFPFTARVCDSLSNCDTQALTLSIAAVSGCGPPNYSCSSTSTANPGVITALFNSTTPTGASSCSGDCQNTSKYDTTINPSGTDCITRVTDGFVLSGASVGNVTDSGGDNDIMWSKNEDFLAVRISGGVDKFFQLSPSGGCQKVVNTGRPAITVTGAMGFSRTTDNVFYSVVAGHLLNKYTIASINTMPPPTTLFDYTAAGKCPGITVNMSVLGNGIMVPNGTDSRFTVMLATGPQGSGIWVASYDPVLGCSTANFQTGQVWTWCASSCSPSTPPLGTFATTGDNCWGANPSGSTGGIHDGQQVINGTYYIMSLAPPWTKGVCAGLTTATQFVSWQIGTLGNQWCSSSSSSTNGHCASHQAFGYTSAIMPNWQGYNFRPIGSLGSGFTNFLAQGIPNCHDIHQGWPHGTGDDSMTWVGACDLVLTGPAHESGCSTSSVYCPPTPENMIVATYPNSINKAITVFAHTFSCNEKLPPPQTNIYGLCLDGIGDPFGSGESIGTTSPQGNWFSWGSTMLHADGNDNTGAPRSDVYVITLQ
jgi:hypothetical protein